MNDDTERNIKQSLENRMENIDAATQQRIRAARQAALDSAGDQPGLAGPGYWRWPAMATAIVLLLAVIMLAPWHMEPEGLAEMAALPQEDVEMLTTLDVEELEPIEFYYWLEQLDDQA